MLKRLAIFLIVFFFMPKISVLAFFGNSSCDLDKGMKKIAGQMAKEKILFNKRVAVLDFKAINGINSLMSTFLATKLLAALGSTPNRKFYLVDRMDIVRLMDEEDSFGGDDFDIDVWAKRLRADFLVIGEYTWLRKKHVLDINCKVVDPKNGSIVITPNVKLKLNNDLLRILNAPPAKKGVASKLEQITSTNSKKGRISLFIIKENKKIPLQGDAPVVKVGDEIGFSIVPPVDSKLYVFNYDPASGDAIFSRV